MKRFDWSYCYFLFLFFLRTFRNVVIFFYYFVLFRIEKKKLYDKSRSFCHLTMKDFNQQPLDVRNSNINHIFEWNSYQIYHDKEHRVPIVDSSPKSTRSYCFDKQKPSTKDHVVTQEPPIKDYFKTSLFACVTCFWMIAGIVCLYQSFKIRQLLKKNNEVYREEARRCSNRLHTNLILTYVFGSMVIGVFVMAILVTFVVGIKGYFSRSVWFTFSCFPFSFFVYSRVFAYFS